jgi:hypothetical protein
VVAIVCYIEPEREAKTAAVLEDFRFGCNGRLVKSIKPVVADQHVVMGMWSGAVALIQAFHQMGVDYWHIDNGWINGSPLNTNSSEDRHYRITRNGMAPKFVKDCLYARAERIGVQIWPWHKVDDGPILITLSSDRMGKPWGVDQDSWLRGVQAVLQTIDRPIVIRSKPSSAKTQTPFIQDLVKAWCLVTHSSSTAVEAVLHGVPVFCEPTNAAWPMANNDYSQIETPVYPGNRKEWVASLVWQQFTRAEMRTGMAWSMIRELVLE